MSINGSYETLFRQAQISVKEYFEAACIIVDDKFGEGYAASNPQLTGQLSHAMAIDLATSIFAQKVAALSDGINDLTSSTS